jgi:monovalent cation/hydrogen antiporter
VNWETVAFLLESGIFLLMGLQLKTLVDQDDVAGLHPWQAVAIGLAAAAVAVVLRVLFVVPLVALLRQDAARGVTNKTQLEQMHTKITDPEMKGRFSARRIEHVVEEIGRRIADIDLFVKENLGWRGGGVLAWSGMRGVVTVAAAQSLPDSTPFRPQIVLIAFVVAGTTLLAQGLTLPAVIRFLKITGDDPVADRAEYGALLTELSAQAEAVLDDPDLVRPDGRTYGAEVLDRARQDALVRSGAAAPPPERTSHPASSTAC